MATSLVPVENKENVAGLECRHATYCESANGKDDMLVVKEYIHFKDGTSKPNLRLIKNFEREFWVTKPGYQNHKDKKEWEQLDRVKKFTTTQIKLKQSIAKALNKPGFQGGLRMLARDPYLYGADVTTPVLLKNQYKTRWPDAITQEAKVAVLDIESDVVYGHGNILSIALTCKEKAVLAVTEDFLDGIPNAEEKIQKAMRKYLKEEVKQRAIDLEVVIAKSPGVACVEVMKRAHDWMPDFISIWNMNYDIPYILKTLESEGFSTADVFSDPMVPPEFRFCKYKEGPSQKVTARGKVLPLHPADRWHVLTCPASWYVLDAMCVYKKIRTVKGNEPNYSLDGVLERNLGVRKLKFDQVSDVEGLAWHQKMQRDYKIEYLIYNLFDCIGVEMLDEKTGDLSRAFDVLTGVSEYANFSSNPRRINDDLHFFCLDRGLVIGTTSDEMVDELDKYVVSMDGWIVTLPSFLVDNNGLPLIKEAPHIRSMLRAHVSDLDIEGTYPNVEDILNISKETTLMELFEMAGVPDGVRRSIGVNLTAGAVNAIEISQRAFNLPTSNQLLASFEREIEGGVTTHRVGEV